MADDRSARPAPGFEAAVHGEGGRLFAVAYSILRDSQEAEDAVQETMELAWRSWDALRDPSKRGAWLRQICVRRAVRMRRRLLPRLWLSDTIETHRQSPEEPDLDLDRCYRRLSRQQRAVVALHYEYGYSIDECAALIGCHKSPVCTGESLARWQLVERLIGRVCCPAGPSRTRPK